MGVATGCGFKEIYRFPHTTYPYSSCICTFCSSILTFLFIFFKIFFVLVPVLFLNNIFVVVFLDEESIIHYFTKYNKYIQ